MRELDPGEDDVLHAARFLYLNKTAWNGLYRVNRAGKFNVPFGLPKSSNIVSLNKLREASAVLLRADLICDDFEITLKDARKGDLVFLDPPYVTSHANNGFVHYNERLFSWSDQIRLAEQADRLRHAGVHVVITNANHSSIRELYQSFSLLEFTRQSTLASDPQKRKQVSELLISSVDSCYG